MHYYQFNIGDYMRDTQHLDELEDLAYRRLLDLCYLSEAPLPVDVKEVARRIRMRSECERIANVLREFFTLTEDGYVNPRASASIEEYKQKGEKARASAKARWSKNKDLPDANALRTECDNDADAMLTNNHKPVTNNHKPEVSKNNVAALDFASLMMSDDQVAAVKAIRKKFGSKGKITQNVINAHGKEFEKARQMGMSNQDIIAEWEVRGWVAFKAEWVRRSAQTLPAHSQYQRPPTPIQLMRDEYQRQLATGELEIDPDEPF